MKKYTDLTWEELLNRTRLWFDLPKVVTEALKRLKAVIDSNQGGVQSITGNLVDNTDPLNPIIMNNVVYSGNHSFGSISDPVSRLPFNVTWNTQNILGETYTVSNIPYSQYMLTYESVINTNISMNNSGIGLPLQIENNTLLVNNIGGFIAIGKRTNTFLINTDNTFTTTTATNNNFSNRFFIVKR